MRIGGTPTVKIRSNRARNLGPLPFPLERKPLFLFSARYALFHALKALGFRPGDTIFAPAYCCGTEIDPILRIGVKIIWYPLREDLSPDVDFLEKSWKPGIKGILVTHYLGFDCLSTDTVAFFDERNLLLIEDCAHAFLSTSESGVPLGSTGHASVFSLRKSLPVPDGACMVLNYSDAVKPSFSLKPPDPAAIFFRISELLVENSTPPGNNSRKRFAGEILAAAGRAGLMLRQGLRLPRKLFGILSDCFVDPNSYQFNENVLNWHISSYSMRKIKSFDFRHIRQRRRRNFRYLSEKISNVKGITFLFRSLKEGACPLFLPIITKNRHEIHEKLRFNGIDSHMWWGYFHPAVPWDSFPRCAELKKTLLGLPIHQDLTTEHLDLMADVLHAHDLEKQAAVQVEAGNCP